jgi:hypothetical protein
MRLNSETQNKLSHGSFRRRGNASIKMDLSVIGCEEIDWIKPTQTIAQ